MADDDKISTRFNRDEEDLKHAFYDALAEAKKQRPDIAKGDVAKALMRQGLSGASGKEHQAAIAEADLEVIRGQIGDITKNVRMLAATMDALREDLATTVLVLLQHAGKLDAAKAEKWVEEVFKS